MFRRRRSRRDSHTSAIQPISNPARSAEAEAKLRRATRATFELLETRTLFTTLFGSEIFEWRQSEDTSVRVALIGNITAELVGAAATSLNQARLGNIPGKLFRSNGRPSGFTPGVGDLFGGIGGGDATTLIGTVTIPGANAAAINLEALASNDAGQTFTINVLPPAAEGGSATVQLVQINNDTGAGAVVADLTAELPNRLVDDDDDDDTPLVPVSTVMKVTAADFQPGTNTMFFVAEDNSPPPGSTEVEGDIVPRIWAVNLNLAPGNPNFVTGGGTFGAAGDVIDVRSISFNDNGAMFAFIARAGMGAIEGLPSSGGQDDTPQVVLLDGERVNDIFGLEFMSMPGDADAQTLMYGVSDGQVLEIDINPDPNLVLNPAEKAIADLIGLTERSVRGLTWNPAISNPFTEDDEFDVGVMLGVNEKDEFFRLDKRNRNPNMNLFTLYVSAADSNARIAIAEVTAYDPEDPTDIDERPMMPFAGSIGSIRVIPAQDGEMITVAAPGASGSVLMGLISREVDPDIDDEDMIPIPTAVVPDDINFGTLPLSFLDTEVMSGLVVEAGSDLGTFLLGGTNFGRVDALGGSIRNYYTGWGLFGDARGVIEEDLRSGSGDAIFRNLAPNNVHIVGDLHNLLAKGSIGTNDTGGLNEPEYLTGAQFLVDSAVGQVLTKDGFAGSMIVGNDIDLSTLLDQQEVERKFRDDEDTDDLMFESGLLKDGETYYNDTFETAQHLGVVGASKMVALTGSISADDFAEDLVDYYGVTLMAGQTVSVQLEILSFLQQQRVLVFDPDGRLIASNYSNVGQGVVLQAPFQFKTDRPGEYRFAVAFEGVDVPNGQPETVAGPNRYRLNVSNVGNIALGAVDSTSNLISIYRGDNAITGFQILDGDLGLIRTGGTLIAEQFDALSDDAVLVENGNLRAIDANEIGFLGQFQDQTISPLIEVPLGSVGLVKSAGQMIFNDAFFNDRPAIAGNYQLVDAGGTFFGDLVANVALGVIRAGNLNVSSGFTDRASYFQANADNIGFDGTLDLLDVQGDMGNFVAGGPIIIMGVGGDAHYIRAGGQVFRDVFFGGGSPEETDFEPGEVFTMNDDSGATITLTPTGVQPNPDFDPLDPTSPLFIGGQLVGVLTYGIRGSGGSVLMEVTSTNGLNVNSGGPRAQVSEITVQGSGLPPLIGEDGSFEFQEPVSDDDLLEVRLAGGPIDVLQITGGVLDRIINLTGGEIVRVQAASIQELRGTNLGLARNVTGMGVYPSDAIAGAFPFEDQRIGIVAGTIGIASASEALGNFIITGDVGTIAANSDGSDNAAVFEGIAGPVSVSGQLWRAVIGEGIAQSGTGTSARSGIFSTGEISSVRGDGAADIRGDIVSTTGIGTVELGGGAIINADIMVVTSLQMSQEWTPLVSAPDGGDSVNRPIFEIDRIAALGAGGIIGTIIVGADIGTVEGGFGILNTIINPVGGTNTVDKVIGHGYGVRSVTIIGGANLRQLSATGTGNSISTAVFTSGVRLSETLGNDFDPNFGLFPNSLTDLHAFLGTSAATPEIPGITTSGIIEDTVAVGQRDLGKVNAFIIRTVNPLMPTTFNFANKIDTIQTLSIIDGLNVTTGSIKNFRPASDVFGLNMTVAGLIKSIQINGSLAGNSSIAAVGPNGSIGSLIVGGNLDGAVSATRSIKKIQVGGDISGSITITQNPQSTNAIGSIVIGGGLANGSLTITGTVGTLEARRNLGAPGDTLLIQGGLRQLKVGTDPSHNGASLALNLNILGDLIKADVMGQIDGAINVGGNITQMKVTRDAGSSATIMNGSLTVGGSIKNAQFINGNMGGNTTVNGSITKLQITNGNFDANSTLISNFGNIGLFQIKNGSLLGNVTANVANGGRIQVTNGNIGDGVNPLAILFNNLTQLKITGSILSGVLVDVAGVLGDLNVGGNIDAGATIMAAAINKQTIGGVVNGSIIIG